MIHRLRVSNYCQNVRYAVSLTMRQIMGITCNQSIGTIIVKRSISSQHIYDMSRSQNLYELPFTLYHHFTIARLH